MEFGTTTLWKDGNRANIVRLSHPQLLAELRFSHHMAVFQLWPEGGVEELVWWLSSGFVDPPQIVGDQDVVKECLAYLQIEHSY
jgi:hypothetical protein